MDLLQGVRKGKGGNNWGGGVGNQQTSSDLVTLKFSSQISQKSFDVLCSVQPQLFQ